MSTESTSSPETNVSPEAASGAPLEQDPRKENNKEASYQSSLSMDRGSQSEHELKNDIGNFINATMSSEEVYKVIDNMDQGQRYDLLLNHDKPSRDFVFPTNFLGQCNRSFKHDWLQTYD